MKKQNSLITQIIVIAIFITVILGCGGTKTDTRPPTVTANNGSPVNTTVNSAPNPPTAPTSTKDVAGNYEVNGTNVNGQGNYKGGLIVTKRGDVYQFSWDVAGSKYDGVGVQTDNAISVSYTDGPDGKGCGVALYKINSDGSLDGKAGYWGVNEGEAEKATRTSGTDLAGEYEVTGTNPEGKEYKNKLKIQASGPGFTFNWTGENSLQGIGVRHGNFVTAGFGGKQCSFVAYELKPDGSLEGKWGGLGTVTFGSEKATKK